MMVRMNKRTKKTRIRLKEQAVIVRKRYKGQPTQIASTLKEIMALNCLENVTYKECVKALTEATEEE